MNRRSGNAIIAALLLASGCDSAAEVEVQPLPSLERSTPEARAGLPQIAGLWRFAGWELAEGDSASLQGELPGFGAVWLQVQKRDSLAGQYVLSGGGRAPLAGEVRRDSVVALVAALAPADLRFLTGRVRRDTLWMEVTSLTEPGTWPGGARAAFVRSNVGDRFARLRGAPPPRAPLDSAAIGAVAGADSARPAAGTAAPTAAAPTAAPAAVATPAPRQSQPTPPPATRTPAAPATPPRRAPAPPAPRPQPAEPEPEPRPRVPLLGEPVRPDTSAGNR